MALLPQKLWRHFFVKIRSQLFQDEKKEEKIPMATKPKGGGEALVARPLRKELFFRLPLGSTCER